MKTIHYTFTSSVGITIDMPDDKDSYEVAEELLSYEEFKEMLKRKAAFSIDDYTKDTTKPAEYRYARPAYPLVKIT